MAQKTRIGEADSGIVRWIAARLFLGIPYLLLSVFIITPVLFLISAVYMVYSIGMTAATGKDARYTRGRYGSKIRGAWRWNANNLRWAVVGSKWGFTVS